MKQTQIKQWLDRVMNPHDRETLQALMDGEFVPNPFLHHITQLTCYILLRLASQETPLQPTLFLEIRNEFQLKFPIILGSVIWQQMNNHPLFQPFIRLEQVKT